LRRGREIKSKRKRRRGFEDRSLKNQEVIEILGA